ncbi:SAICAR synthase-like protein [Xylariaceae sp. FL1651]|nr:SAICAR synthase-like protein [Xylariaceae sp. FL1651]
MATELKRCFSSLSSPEMPFTPELRELKRAKTAPTKPKEVPKHEDLVTYKHAVAGHDGTMCDADGELFVKPCTQAEVDFYESAKFHPDFAELMPVYCGALALLNTTTAATIHEQLPGLIEQADIPMALKEELKSHLHSDSIPAEKNLTANGAGKDEPATEKKWTPKTGPIKTDRAIALLNASYGFKKPNIMDAKLGVRLWANDAPKEKQKRFDEITQKTTHKHFGFRVAGMHVYKGSQPIKATKHVSGPNEEGFMIYDKFWGREDVNDENLVDSLKLFIFNEAAGINKDLGKLVAGLFARDLRRVEEVLEKEESRMYSSSLLFVFEGDGAALRAAIEEAKAEEAEGERVTPEAVVSVSKRTAPRAISANLRVDSGIDMDDEELKFVTEEIKFDDELEEEDGDLEELSTFPQIYSLKMIDFAHAAWTPGQGPDEDVLMGVRSLASIFEELSE